MLNASHAVLKSFLIWYRLPYRILCYTQSESALNILLVALMHIQKNNLISLRLAGWLTDYPDVELSSRTLSSLSSLSCSFLCQPRRWANRQIRSEHASFLWFGVARNNARAMFFWSNLVTWSSRGFGIHVCQIVGFSELTGSLWDEHEVTKGTVWDMFLLTGITRKLFGDHGNLTFPVPFALPSEAPHVWKLRPQVTWDREL